MEPQLDTPYFVCDGKQLRRNCEIVNTLREQYRVDVLFAIKAMTMCKVFPHMAPYFDGVVASSLWEARIAREHFHPPDGAEVHVYSPAFIESELPDLLELCDCLVFNSQDQQARFGARVREAGRNIGLRLNPDVSRFHDGVDGLGFCSKHSRLGVRREALREDGLDELSGVLFHVNSENRSLGKLVEILQVIEATFAEVLVRPNIGWISLGGGISFAEDEYPVAKFGEVLQAFGQRWNARVILEPGSTVSSRPFTLHATVLDVVHNQLPVAILDISAEAHLPDRLLFGIQYPVAGAEQGDEGEGVAHLLSGVSCLGGDELGIYRFPAPLQVGDRVAFEYTGDYTMVQQNYFNGVRRPSVYFRHESGELELLKAYAYEDFARVYD